jgi:hypothetical protein
MPNDLTDAEQAIADSLYRVYRDTADGVFTHAQGAAEFAAEARVTAAAVRPLLAAEALRAEADILERAVQSENAMSTMFVVPAHLWLRDRAEIRLRAAHKSEEDQR